MPPTLMRSSSRYFPNGTGCLTRSDGSGGSTEITTRKGGVRPGSAATPGGVFWRRGVHGPWAIGDSVGVAWPIPIVRRAELKAACDPDGTGLGRHRSKRLKRLFARSLPISLHTIVHAVGVDQDGADPAGEVERLEPIGGAGVVPVAHTVQAATRGPLGGFAPRAQIRAGDEVGGQERGEHASDDVALGAVAVLELTERWKQGQIPGSPGP